MTTLKEYLNSNTGVTVKFNDGKVSVAAPSIRYYYLDHWTINGSGSYSTAELATELASMATASTLTESTIVKAFFVRQYYTVKIYSVVNGGGLTDEHYSFRGYAGRSFYVNASATVDNVPFSYWKIGPASEYTKNQFNDISEVPEIKTSYFVSEVENNGEEIMAIAYFTSTGQSETNNHPKVSVADYWADEYDGSYRLVMTLSVIAPPDTTGFSIKEVGFGVTTDTERRNAGEFEERAYSGWDGWTSGTYTLRYAMPSADTVAYTYGYVIYELNGTTYKTFATYNNQTDPVVDAVYPDYAADGSNMPKTTYYDVMDRTGRTSTGERTAS